MNCANCGKKLYPEAPFCPHCGKPNEQRIILEEQISSFDRAYDATVGDVMQSVQRKNRFFGKLAAVLILLFFFILSLFGHGLLSSFVYDARQKKIESQISDIIAQEDAYLDAQDYFGLFAYTEHLGGLHMITNCAPAYTTVNNAARAYCDTVLHILYYREEAVSEKPYMETLESRARSIRSDVETFYESADPDRISYLSEAQTRLEDVEQMKRNIEALLVSGFGMPAADAVSLSELKPGARALLLERYVHPEENE